MGQGQRLGVLLVTLLASVGLLVWQVALPRQPSPRRRPAPPVRRIPPPATAAPSQAAQPRARCGDAEFLARVQRYVAHRLEGNTGEILVERCDGSEPLALAQTGLGGWGNLRAEEHERPGIRTLWFERDAEVPGSGVMIGVSFGLERPESQYEATLEIVSPAWKGCPSPLQARYEILSFPRPSGPGDHLHAEFIGLCRETGELVTGFVRVPGRPAEELAPPRAEVAAAAGGEAPDEEPTQDDPLDALRPCPARALAPNPASPDRAGALEWLWAARWGAAPGGRWIRPPSAMNMVSLARRYVKRLDLDGPLTPAMRRSAAELQRQIYGTEGDPDPFTIPFDVPAGEIPGHFHAFDGGGPAEVRALGAAGRVQFGVDRNGCEVHERRYEGSIHVAAAEEAVLLWSATPIAWGAPRRLDGAKELSVRKVPARSEYDAEHFQVTLAVGDRKVSGHADSARFAGAYLVDAGARTFLWVNYAGPDVEGGFCVGMVVYAVGEELVELGSWKRDPCL